MNRASYSMFKTSGDREEIVACDIPLERALVLAVEHGRTGRAILLYEEKGAFRSFEIGRCSCETGAFEGIVEVLIRRSEDPAGDADEAMATFEDLLVNNPGVFWDGRVVSNSDGKHRRANNIIKNAS